MDAIDRQAAIEAVGYYSLHSGDKLLFADKPLRELPSAQPEPKWIPVSERLPEKDGYYLTTTMYYQVRVDAMPTIEERKSGKWEVYYDDEYPTDSAVRCTNCHAWFVEESAAAWEYCPHCGARMER